jgi:3-dehydroquinate synthase
MPVSYELLITSSSGAYPVRIAPGAFGALLEERTDQPVIADAFFAAALAARTDRVIVVEAVEANKTLGEGERIIEALRDMGIGRGESVVALGGGIVQDVSTLAVSLYMRGIPWTYVPTTLLGMADSCIGGKSSINVGPYKNLAGNFHPPTEIVVDPDFIRTLTPEDRVGGMCEAMKISFCRGPEAFARYVELQSQADCDNPEAEAALLAHVLGCKKWFIEVDEFDKKERRQLNFGHTFAHALEAATYFQVSHGAAVGIGVVAADRLAVALGLPGAPDLRAHALDLLAGVPDLGPRLADVDEAAFTRAFLLDKKHGPDGLHVIVPAAGGATEERVLPEGDETMAMVRGALDGAINEVSACR